MYELLYFNDFPECQNYKILVKDSNKNNLIDECKNRLKQAEYCNSQTMLCIIDNGQVIHPVISNLKGGTTHPRQDGWIWLSGTRYTAEEREKNHKEFTEKLKSHMQGIVTPAMKNPKTKGPVQKEKNIQDNIPKSTSVPPKKQMKEKAAIPELSVEESKKIIYENFKKLQTAYRAKYKKDFLESEDFKMFFSSKDAYEKIIEWNKKAENRNDLIDITGFYELCLGNPENADIVILGKNPGAGQFDRLKNDSELVELFREMDLRKISKDRFFPLHSFEAMMYRPWFPVRLIFGKHSDNLPDDEEGKNGILSKFINSVHDACKYAGRICSLELVPYHTATFEAGEHLIEIFGMVQQVLEPVRNAMAKEKIILIPYSSTVDKWCRYLPELKRYKYTYTTHRNMEQQIEGKNADPWGSLNIDKLRHVGNIKTPRTADENCDALFERLIELGWEKI